MKNSAKVDITYYGFVNSNIKDNNQNSVQNIWGKEEAMGGAIYQGEYDNK